MNGPAEGMIGGLCSFGPAGPNERYKSLQDLGYIPFGGTI